MSYAESWNYMVRRHKELYHSQESAIQRDWEDYFLECFGYKRSLKEIDSQRSITIGSGERVIPDIIIKTNEHDLFDVELKQYNLSFSEEMQKQLISYLKQLRISIGVLVCQKIYICVYDYVNDTIKKFDISFVENDPDGIKFVELFQKENFSAERIEEFIDSKTSFSNNVAKIKSELNSENLLELIKIYFEDSYSKEEIDSALKDVFIEVKFKNEVGGGNVGDGKNIDEPGGQGPGRTGMDNTRYCFEGHTYVKCRLVLAVVKAYVRDNPSITYSELKNIFYKRLQGSTGVIATPSEARVKVQDPEKRYFTNSIIYLKDTPIYVCTQWGIGNIGNFIDKAISLGYKIEKVGR